MKNCSARRVDLGVWNEVDLIALVIFLLWVFINLIGFIVLIGFEKCSILPCSSVINPLDDIVAFILKYSVLESDIVTQYFGMCFVPVPIRNSIEQRPRVWPIRTIIIMAVLSCT